ncbi:MAG: gamma-glutamyltransferase family protein [Proteobacteria bacterium]|nr:gamma-glutamyltransferase family protein [Pseudomonadota bacterium]
MAGVVAAGAAQTAEAGAEILRCGGNAVDAAIAGAVAAFVAEPLLASAGGGGIMTLAMPGQEPASIDFFSHMPGLGGRAAELDFFAIDIDFGPVTQEFHIGRGSAAVPGILPGLAEAHRRYGSLPLADLMAPAIRLANQGVEVSAEVAHVFDLIWPILAVDRDTVRVLAGGRRPEPGDRLGNPEFGEVLREFAALGRTPDRVVEGLLDEFGPARGGMITESDIAAFKPKVGPPRVDTYGDWSVYLPATPGGGVTMTILHDLAQSAQSSEERVEVLRYARASRAGHAERKHFTAPGSTTHISVVDTERGAASVTLTNGEGCGYLIPGTGIAVNNFLGEADLNPAGFHSHEPGVRLPTMVAPCVGVRHGVPALALGSGGSNRIRSAVGGVLYRVVVVGQSIEEAVRAPRVHAEDDAVWVELEGMSDPEAVVARLAGDFVDVHRFARRDFFFGGVHAAALDESGSPHGIGDSRRGGVSLCSF